MSAGGGAGNIGNLIGGLGSTVGGLATSFGGASDIESGAALQASSYRSAGSAAMSAARYNVQLINLNLGRQLTVLSREIRAVSGAQRAAGGASGIAIGSSSNLALINDALSGFERESMLVRNTARAEREKTLFEGRIEKAALENQARAAEFSGDVAAKQARASAIGGAVSGVGSLFTSLAG